MPRTCEIEGCGRPHYARGLCRMHYVRMTSGSPKARDPQPLILHLTEDEAFARYVSEGSPDECWEWAGSRHPFGYGSWRGQLMHRVSLARSGVNVGSSDLVLHSCDNPPCVNPSHLRVGSVLDNVRDAVNRGRHPTGPDHANAKLTPDQVREIRSSIESQAQMAKRFGVTQAAISAVRLRKTYRNVPDLASV